MALRWKQELTSLMKFKRENFPHASPSNVHGLVCACVIQIIVRFPMHQNHKKFYKTSCASLSFDISTSQTHNYLSLRCVCALTSLNENMFVHCLLLLFLDSIHKQYAENNNKNSSIKYLWILLVAPKRVCITLHRPVNVQPVQRMCLLAVDLIHNIRCVNDSTIDNVCIPRYHIANGCRMPICAMMRQSNGM